MRTATAPDSSSSPWKGWNVALMAQSAAPMKASASRASSRRTDRRKRRTARAADPLGAGGAAHRRPVGDGGAPADRGQRLHGHRRLVGLGMRVEAVVRLEPAVLALTRLAPRGALLCGPLPFFW